VKASVMGDNALGEASSTAAMRTEREPACMSHDACISGERATRGESYRRNCRKRYTRIVVIYVRTG